MRKRLFCLQRHIAIPLHSFAWASRIGPDKHRHAPSIACARRATMLASARCALGA